ncbi:MAG TPA: alpha/beta hydrolase [Acidimicrobiales bacterium]|nr:alpha/beta hydrolase [Acidimicrobiales bacterium]
MTLDPEGFRWQRASPRGFSQAFVRENPGGVPLLLVHGWPETARIWWRVIEPLAAAGFEVVAPDLRGFGRSEIAPDGFHDVASHSLDLHALMGWLGHERFVVAGGDLGGAVVQDMALRFPDAVTRMVVFNSPLPYDRERMAGMDTKAPAVAADYFLRQGTDADALAAELDTPEKRRRYIATFYGPRFWAHPGTFDREAVDFMTEPFGDGVKLRASFGTYESAFSEAARSALPMLGRNERTEALILFGPSDHVLYADFDRMAAVVLPRHVGPFLLRDCGHFVPWEAPGPFVSAVRTFCRDLLPG